MAINTRTNKVYVALAHVDSRRVAVIDGATNQVITYVNTVGVPNDVVVDEGRNKVYVSTTDSNQVVMIDGVTHAVARTINCFAYPRFANVMRMAHNPHTGKLYVTNSTRFGFTMIRCDTGLAEAVADFPVWTTWPVATNLRTNRVYVGSSQSKLAVVGAEPAEPQQVSPPDTASGLPSSFDMTWGSTYDADSYELQVSDQFSFASTLVSETGLTDTTYTASGLPHSTPLYWRLRAVNDVGPSTWSVVWSFTLAPATGTAAALTVDRRWTLRVSTQGRLSVAVPGHSTVVLRLYDAAGRVLHSATTAQRAADVRSVPMSNERLAPGRYVLRLSTAELERSMAFSYDGAGLTVVR
jgi:YVTN family beta-propeller protein